MWRRGEGEKGRGPARVWSSDYHTIQYITTQYSTLQHNTVHYHTIQYITTQYSTLPHNTVHYHTIQYTRVHTPLSPSLGGPLGPGHVTPGGGLHTPDLHHHNSGAGGTGGVWAGVAPQAPRHEGGRGTGGWKVPRDPEVWEGESLVIVTANSGGLEVGSSPHCTQSPPSSHKSRTLLDTRH